LNKNMTDLAEPLRAKRDAALRRLRTYERVAVALSGGVDSAVLLNLAVEALGADRVLAVTGCSPSLAATELEDARRIAAAAGVRHDLLETTELLRAGYRENAGDRCFHCRTELFERMGEHALQNGVRHVAYGAIKDDTDDHRPGMIAARRAGAHAPLLEAGLDKTEIRTLARAAGLAIGDKPATACLASRIPVGTPVDAERLARIERAERALRGLGFTRVRVRDHDPVARIELDPEGIDRLSDPDLRSAVSRAVHEAGFRFVTVDLDGYRSGSLNPGP
jgi:uncharacterized protein